MKVVLLSMLVLALLAFALPEAAAAEYHGVQVGQRADYLPPEFDEVVRGEYQARFGNELLQVFSAGGIVQGFKVVPLAPMTLAEAIASHSPQASSDDLRFLQNFNRDILALADASNRIAYFTESARPDSIVHAVGYYNDQTALMTFAAPVPARQANELVAAARRSSGNEIDRRPGITDPLLQASFIVDQATQVSRADAQRALLQLRHYTQLCTGTPTCDTVKREQGFKVITAAARFLTNLMRAENAYQANANLIGERPAQLTQLQELSDDLIRQVRSTVGPVRFTRR